LTARGTTADRPPIERGTTAERPTRPPAGRVRGSWWADPYADGIIRSRRLSFVLVAFATVVAASGALTACSDLLQQADAVVVLEAPDRPAVLRLRQELLDQSGSWGGVRVGETTAEQQGDTALTFSLPGRNLDAALGSIGRLNAVVRSTSIDVKPEQVDRNAPVTTSAPGADAPGADRVRLRVEIAEASPGGAGALLRLVMAVFSVVGMVAVGLWILNWTRRRGQPSTPSDGRRRRIIDMRGDPPTEETPRVPRQDR